MASSTRRLTGDRQELTLIILRPVQLLPTCRSCKEFQTFVVVGLCDLRSFYGSAVATTATFKALFCL